MRKFICNILSTILLIIAMAGCTDDPLYTTTETGEGEASISAEVTFRPLSAALSRSAGNAIKSIDNIHVFVYKNGNLEKHIIPTDIITDYSNENTPSDYNGTKAEKTTASASFSIGKLPYGTYKIYAVANVDQSLLTDDATATEDGLKNISLTWNNNSVASNSEMFGYFTTNDESNGFNAPSITVNSASIKLKAWLKRAASKVTVAFDGSQLNDGVCIYLKSVQIKHIPKSCLLGSKNSPGTPDNDQTPADQNKITELLTDGEIIPYSAGTSYDETWTARVSRQRPYYGLNNEVLTTFYADQSHSTDDINNLKAALHSENVESLYFYENMQGQGVEGTASDKRQAVNQQDKDNGHPSYPEGNDPSKDGWKDAKPFGTYIEVKAFYLSNESCGNITYRFMLGKDVITDYEAERNHHYKLTLNFINDANNVDWHIDYDQQILTVTQPKTFDYLGEIFISDEVPYTNYGHEFSKENPIIVTSYNEQSPDKFNDCKVSIENESGGNASDWLAYEWRPIEGKTNQQELVLSIKKEKISQPDEEFTIDSKLKVAPKGDKSAPHDLAASGTANCYMIDAPGWYSLPLVYGNATEGEHTYKCTSASGDDFLPNFKNHLGDDITGPYITSHISADDYKDLKSSSASIVWQDEQNLVTDVEYVSNLYGTNDGRNIGGIRFQVPAGNIKQGNAVIAIKDSKGDAMWSWHIWVTNLDFQKTITVTTNQYGERCETYELMPVNLGWCSGHDDKVRIFHEHKFKVTIECGTLSETVDIVKASHVAFTRGNNPYYQWGRKDPFWGSNASWANKERWDGTGNYFDSSGANNPKRFFHDSYNTPEGVIIDESLRKNTREYLPELIKHPDTWHNPPRRKIPNTTNEFERTNKTYSNLWGWVGEELDASVTQKTVYDPCPVGYLVPHYNAFTGFVVKRWNNPTDPNRYWVIECLNSTELEKYGYDVKKERITPSENPTDYLYEFYTDATKVYSIIFPETGYRDWDAAAEVYFCGADNYTTGIGYVWSRNILCPEYDRVIWGNKHLDSSYNLEFTRSIATHAQKGIKPINAFATCDGMPIRPAAVPIMPPEEETRSARPPLRR